MAQDINIRMDENPRPDTPNAETLAAIADVNKRRTMHGPFGSVGALMEDLEADSIE